LALGDGSRPPVRDLLAGFMMISLEVRLCMREPALVHLPRFPGVMSCKG
jgi:hypothetical protein